MKPRCRAWPRHVTDFKKQGLGCPFTNRPGRPLPTSHLIWSGWKPLPLAGRKLRVAALPKNRRCCLRDQVGADEGVGTGLIFHHDWRFSCGFSAMMRAAVSTAPPTVGPPRGGLAGVYVGASGSVTAGVGVGANVLFGGSGRSIALQPLSVQGQIGLDLTLGVSGLELRPVR